MHRLPATFTTCLVIALGALAIAGCGDDDRSDETSGRNSATPTGSTSQARLDDVMDLVGPTLDALERAYPAGEGDDGEAELDAIIEAFSAALRDLEDIDAVEEHRGWTWDDPLPCGSGADPSTGVIGIDEGDGSFFIGPSSETWIAGFGEDSEGDRGIAIAPCEDGSATNWRYLPATDSTGAVRVSTLSFADAGSSERQLMDTAFDGVGSATGGNAIDVDADWSPEDGLPCASSATPERIVSAPDSPTTVDGFATNELVVAAALRSYVDGGEEPEGELPWLIGSCEDGRASELRALALPLDDLRGPAGDVM